MHVGCPTSKNSHTNQNNTTDTTATQPSPPLSNPFSPPSSHTTTPLLSRCHLRVMVGGWEGVRVGAGGRGGPGERGGGGWWRCWCVLCVWGDWAVSEDCPQEETGCSPQKTKLHLRPTPVIWPSTHTHTQHNTHGWGVGCVRALMARSPGWSCGVVWFSGGSTTSRASSLRLPWWLAGQGGGTQANGGG
jgi:hypothetical protein